MEAVQLHDKENDVIGTVSTTDYYCYIVITDLWDEYLMETNDPDIYEFQEKYCPETEVLIINIYQP